MKATVRPGMMIHTGDSDKDSNHFKLDNDQEFIGHDRYHEAFTTTIVLVVETFMTIVLVVGTLMTLVGLVVVVV